MPQCARCHMLVGGQCTAHTIARDTLGRDLLPPPLGACMIPIVESYLPFIKRTMRVLEIGCGSWDRIRSHCRDVGAHYEGIDPQTEYFGKRTVATRVENLAESSFPNEDFDLVIGSQTMEHWAEYGCSLRWGLYQCFRVCKPGGKVLLNVPIHYHGTREFSLGEMDALQRLFAPFSDAVSFEQWGTPTDPLPALWPYPGYWSLRDKPAHVLDIRATKDRPLPGAYRKGFAPSGRLAQLLNYPMSYNLYRILCKARLLPQPEY